MKLFLSIIMVLVAVTLVSGFMLAPMAQAQENLAEPDPPGRLVELAAPLPLPVTGSVNVSNLPPAREPVQFYFSHYCPTNGLGCGYVTMYTVPSDKRLVIEYVSFRISQLTDPDVLAPSIQTSVGGTLVPHTLGISSDVVTGLGGGSDGTVVFAENVKLYADPDTNVQAGFTRTIGVSDYGYFMSISVSGYLEAVP